MKNDVTATILHGMIDRGWNRKKLASLTGFSESKTSRVINHPESAKLSDIQLIIRKLGIKQIEV